MKTVLKVMGVLTIMGGLILGINYSSPLWRYEGGLAFLILVACIIGGIVTSLIYFALSLILDKLENIEIKMYGMNDDVRAIKEEISNSNVTKVNKDSSTNANKPNSFTINRTKHNDYAEWTCKSCGYKNPAGQLYCKSCGEYK